MQHKVEKLPFSWTVVDLGQVGCGMERLQWERALGSVGEQTGAPGRHFAECLGLREGGCPQKLEVKRRIFSMYLAYEN